MYRKIDISNYEEWFIDHLDGNLTDGQEIQFKSFLLEHPELVEDLEGMDAMRLEVSSTIYPDKNDLLMPNEDELSILLAAEENRHEILDSLSKVERIELEELKRTLLQADPLIIFPDKETLKKQEGGLIIPLWVGRFAIAASMIGIVFLLVFRTEAPTYDPRTIAVDISDENVDELFTADYTEFVNEKSESQGIESKKFDEALNDQKAEPALLVQDNQLPEELKDDFIGQEQTPDIEEDFAQSPSIEIEDPVINDEQSQSIAESDKEPFDVPDEELPENLEVNDSFADNQLKKTGQVKEYNSVLSFLKDRVKQTAEENDLLAMDDLSQEDKYIRTSFRIGGVEFSRTKKRK